MSDDLIERVARAWAVMDGKADRFDACKADPAIEETEGRYRGYLADADGLLEISGVAAELTRLRAKVEALTEVLHNAHSHQLAACAEWEGEMSKARGVASHKLAAARYAGHYSAANDLAKRIAALSAEVLGKGDVG